MYAQTIAFVGRIAHARAANSSAFRKSFLQKCVQLTASRWKPKRLTDLPPRLHHNVPGKVA